MFRKQNHILQTEIHQSTCISSQESGIGGVLLELFRAFSLRCAQLHEAVRLGDDARVATLDSAIDPLIDTILAYRATNLLEVCMQLQFVSHLLEQDADDSACVSNYAAVLSHLLNRYFGGHLPDWRGSPVENVLLEEPAAYMPNTDNGNFLNAAILETLPDRVAVLTKDYRYLYSNSANSAHLGKKPMDMIGHHLVEFIGEERFARQVKSRLDACFAGQRIDYEYERYIGNERRQVRCRMSPLRDATDGVIGALIVIQDKSADAGTRAA